MISVIWCYSLVTPHGVYINILCSLFCNLSSSEVKKCSEPDTVNNAVIVALMNLIGGYAIYQCEPGYVFEEGGTVRTVDCNESSKWSSVIPGCVGKRNVLIYQY